MADRTCPSQQNSVGPDPAHMGITHTRWGWHYVAVWDASSSNKHC